VEFAKIIHGKMQDPTIKTVTHMQLGALSRVSSSFGNFELASVKPN